MKFRRIAAFLCVLAIGLTACGKNSQQVGTPAEEGGGAIAAADSMQGQLEARCGEIAAMYRSRYDGAEKTASANSWEEPALSQDSIDAIENLLIDAGLDVMDTNGSYPSYLVTSSRFHSFWEAAQRHEKVQQEVIRIAESGKLMYQLFTCEASGNFLYSMIYPLDGGEPYYEMHDIKDWELTEKDNFFYRILPADDKHYPDFSLIRLTPPDLELCDMTADYIFPVGYIATNLFLTDWSEGNWGNLSFNDQFENLYFSHYGTEFTGEGYSYLDEEHGYAIPAAEFEEIVLPYYNIALDTFRSLAQYHSSGDYYVCRTLKTDDFVFLWYYSFEPEVTAYTKNADGTITLTVEALSTDLKMDCLFAHEVTVRPLENGRFQYVGNRVTYQTEYGLPYAVPRLEWDT